MPFPLSRAKEVVKHYKAFPDRLRSSQEDIIKILYGKEIRGRTINSMPDHHQVFCFSRRLYREAIEMVKRIPVQAPAKISDLEEKVEGKPEQILLFDNRREHWQY